MTTTITTTSPLSQYSDYHGAGEVEVHTLEGVAYVGVEACPRGFANETTTYVARADDAAAVQRLQALVDRTYGRDIGDDWRCEWLSRKRLAQHLYTARSLDGWRYLLTLMTDGREDVIRV